MSKPVVIKKYENRRLYDTSGSRYVNLPEIAQMMREGVDVQVFDARTGEDITRLILTQIIVEDTRNKKSDLPLDFLRGLIITSDRVIRDFVAWYAQATILAQRGAQQAVEATPFSSALPLIEKLFEVARPKDLGATRRGEGGERDAESETVTQLRARVDELEQALRSQGAQKAPRRKAARKREAAPAAADATPDGTGEGR